MSTVTYWCCCVRPRRTRLLHAPCTHPDNRIPPFTIVRPGRTSRVAARGRQLTCTFLLYCVRLRRTPLMRMCMAPCHVLGLPVGFPRLPLPALAWG